MRWIWNFKKFKIFNQSCVIVCSLKLSTNTMKTMSIFYVWVKIKEYLLLFPAYKYQNNVGWMREGIKWLVECSEILKTVWSFITHLKKFQSCVQKFGEKILARKRVGCSSQLNPTKALPSFTKDHTFTI